MKLFSKEFYEAMEMFERTSKHLIRTGSMGYKREPKESWGHQVYYCDGIANEAFNVFLAGVSYGKAVNDAVNSEIVSIDREKLRAEITAVILEAVRDFPLQTSSE